MANIAQQIAKMAEQLVAGGLPVEQVNNASVALVVSDMTDKARAKVASGAQFLDGRKVSAEGLVTPVTISRRHIVVGDDGREMVEVVKTSVKTINAEIKAARGVDILARASALVGNECDSNTARQVAQGALKMFRAPAVEVVAE